MMARAVRILLADRNRHVRELLRRELESEGYIVIVARDAPEILGLLTQGELPDLLILDPEVPYVIEANLQDRLRTFYPTLPVIIHSFHPGPPQGTVIADAAAFLEKAEDPHRLKATIAALVAK